MLKNFKNILLFYYNNLVLGQPKKLIDNEIAECYFFEENYGRLALTHYWLRQLYWPLNLLVLYTGFFIYQAITNPKFFDIDFFSYRNTESLIALSVILALIIVWSTIALIGRTTIIFTVDKFVLLERPFTFLSFGCKSLEIKNFELLTKYRQDPDNPEVYVFNQNSDHITGAT